MIRVLVNGAAGRMGQLACAAIGNAGDLELVARCGRGDDLAARIRSERVDVAVDFTLPEVAGSNALAMVAAGARPIIGTSGLMPAQRDELARRSAASRLGGVVAPNFAIGALLLMHFSELAARWLPAVEIVESHHPGKKDAPSGTAIATAERIAAARPASRGESGAGSATEPFAPCQARGDRRDGVPIHSLRLPGIVAEQSVIFGELGQKLVIEHVAYSREAYMPGVLLACRRVMQLRELVVGLDRLLFGGDKGAGGA